MRPSASASRHVTHVHDERHAGEPRREGAVSGRPSRVRVHQVGPAEGAVRAGGDRLRHEPHCGDDLEAETAPAHAGGLAHADEATGHVVGKAGVDTEALLVGGGDHHVRRPRCAGLQHAEQGELGAARDGRMVEVQDARMRWACRVEVLAGTRAHAIPPAGTAGTVKAPLTTAFPLLRAARASIRASSPGYLVSDGKSLRWGAACAC